MTHKWQKILEILTLNNRQWNYIAMILEVNDMHTSSFKQQKANCVLSDTTLLMK
jgi:hypothetical protein